MEASRQPEHQFPDQFHTPIGVMPDGYVCTCGRDYLTLSLEEASKPCPCARRRRTPRRWSDDEEGV